jgi:hypothetical protein
MKSPVCDEIPRRSETFRFAARYLRARANAVDDAKLEKSSWYQFRLLFACFNTRVRYCA